jgi:hypothetical protein
LAAFGCRDEFSMPGNLFDIKIFEISELVDQRMNVIESPAEAQKRGSQPVEKKRPAWRDGADFFVNAETVHKFGENWR